MGKKKMANEDINDLWTFTQGFENTGTLAPLEEMRQILRKYGYECGTISTALRSAYRILGWE